jgi:hypothetical protein
VLLFTHMLVAVVTIGLMPFWKPYLEPLFPADNQPQEQAETITLESELVDMAEELMEGLRDGLREDPDEGAPESSEPADWIDPGMMEGVGEDPGEEEEFEGREDGGSEDPSPRKELKSIVDDLNGRFKEALYKSEMFQVAEKYLKGETPEFNAIENKAELYHLEKKNSYTQYVTRVGIEFLDYSYNRTEKVAEFKLEIYRELRTYTEILGNITVSGGRLTNRYTLYFAYENGDFVLDKMTRSGRGISSDGFSEPKIFSHSKEPAIQVLFEGNVEF